MRVAAVEGGGTTWVVAIADGSPDNIVERHSVRTESPEATIGNIREWLRHREFQAIGIATFGPVDAKKNSPTFGFITSTPKRGWANTDVLGLLGIRDEFQHIPFSFDTDVNAPALAEYKLFESQTGSSCAYVTVGTGIGVGLVVNGQTVHGLMHPEAGHIFVRKHPRDEFLGTCPFHGCCVEGLCSTGALAARKGCTVDDLPGLADEDPIWDFWAYYMAQLCANLVLIASPERISIGGGVLNRRSLLPRIRRYVVELLAGYVVSDRLTDEGIQKYICPSHWDCEAGIVGSAYLGFVALESQ